MSGELISVTLYFGPQPPKGLETSVFEALENTRKWKFFYHFSFPT
jgi:hypothetical protein